MASVLSKNVVERSAWTAAEIIVSLAVVLLGGISAWWAVPLATVLAAVKTNIVDKHAEKSPPVEGAGP